ncbi:Uma2 family endonuclease [Actinoplanes solisilvae]|uniref:Uma2 family endonuclease n=1 Tax=Actinoplanes solisilvae TaxID=2486853 RepID=UPI000FD947E6|nr:Uma2 family endonuclease [Actinoplanes solisilvae]
MAAGLQRSSELDDKDDWTVDDLASLSEDLRYELIDGRLIVLHWTVFHQNLCQVLAGMLWPGCPPSHMPVPQVSIEVDPRNEPRPDVVVMRKAYAFRASVPVDGALLVVDVVSASSHFRDLYAKWKLYAAHDVGTYLVVDPTFEGGVMLTECRLGENGHYDEVISTNKTFTTDFPYPITIDVPALTALRDDFRRAEGDP